MKRYMDLVRKLLLGVEAHTEPTGWLEPHIDGFSDDELAYHVKLLRDAGLVEAEDFSTFGSFRWYPKRLTWAGHEFLDTVKNDTVWHKTKQVVIEKGGSISVELLKTLASKLAAAHFGLE